MKHVELKFEDYKFSVPTEKGLAKKLQPLLDELKTCGSLKTALPLIKKWNKAMIDITTNFSIIYVKYSCYTNNPAFVRAQEKCDEVSPILSNYNNEYMKILTKALYRKDLEKLYGPYLLKMYDFQLKSFDEKIIPDLIEENKLSSQYDRIRGGAKIEFRGGTYNLSQMGKFLNDVDRQTRKEAAIACDKWWADNEAEVAEIYDKLVHLRDGMAKKLGFKNFVDLGYLRLGRTDYTSKNVKNYRDQIAEEVVPLCQKLYKEQVRRLNIKKPQYYDYLLVFADGNPLPAGDEAYLVEEARKMYTDLGKEGGEFFNYMTRNQLMDLSARSGKAPGG
ncbi:MAG: M3 family oligoendopeptidase, partial [Bacilli bacterium]|nr:M3 family oligoendopeptidase [Bacilli bacterium]